MASGLENIETIESPFRRFVTTIGVFPTAFTDAMTYYECLAYLVKYMEETLIPAINENAEAVEELQGLYIQLKSFVDNYFENLDVQEEINNKLDEMVSDGTFELIIGKYFREQFNILDQKIDNTADDLKNQLNLAITNETNARTNADTNLQAQITALGSGSPIPVSSTSAMTDQSKVYVNTTDGNWYYWNGSAWTSGGTYQASGLASDSIHISTLSDDVRDQLFENSTNISDLQLSIQSTSVWGANYTSPFLILAGTTITFSSDFTANYKWSLIRVENGLIGTNFTTETTASSYQLQNDEYCVLMWRPRDNKWDTTNYTVDRTHKLDSSDITSISFYYPKIKEISEGMTDSAYADFAFNCRTFDSNGVLIWDGNTRYGSMIAFKSSSKCIVTMSDTSFNIAIITVTDRNGSNYNAYTLVHDSGWLTAGSYEVSANTPFMISIKATDNSNISTLIPQIRKALKITTYPTYEYVDNTVNQIPANIPDYDKFVKGINHRGYNTVAPENTIPAFKLSAKNGFKYVESDVQFTSDSVPVMIHDATIDRTSNGTGNVADMTYAQLSQYDFGSWKSSAYTGTKIPTLYEFIKCCKDCGLTPYIEIKTVLTDAQCTIIENALKQYDMIKDATFISFMPDELTKIHNKIPQARIGLLVNYNLTSWHINIVNSLKGDENEVFVDIWTDFISDDNVNICMEANIPFEVWTPNTDQAILNLPNYVTGVTSDIKIAGKVLLDNALTD